VRLRRDDLVRLCESRDLNVEGTKPQLAEALLQWRDRQSEASSPSSAGTVRPPSTVRARRRGISKSTSSTPPVLLRPHIHLDKPRTPPLSSAQRERDEELELDLESLGLEDREIPPDKLMKLEKIGSGGFKDVFVGKFKGRKVAIAEFRGHLTGST
jgi:mitogen-activated protein kinase kinase kinase 13